jgi:hypothetical protein
MARVRGRGERREKSDNFSSALFNSRRSPYIDGDTHILRNTNSIFGMIEES